MMTDKMNHCILIGEGAGKDLSEDAAYEFFFKSGPLEIRKHMTTEEYEWIMAFLAKCDTSIRTHTWFCHRCQEMVTHLLGLCPKDPMNQTGCELC